MRPASASETPPRGPAHSTGTAAPPTRLAPRGISLNHIREHAICGGRPVEDFFPPAPMDAELKRKIARPPLEIQNLCGRCPVEGECLSWALAHREYGIWGGTTEVQRARIRKSRVRSFCVRCDETSAIVRGSAYSVCMACGLSWKAPGFNVS